MSWEVITGNSAEVLKTLPSNHVHLTVTSPPYDNLREYKGYSFPFETIARELYRVTKPGGVVVWVVSDATIDGSESGTSFKQALFFKECGFRLYDTMIWEKPAPSSPTEGRYYAVFEYMFVFSKGKPATLNLISDRPNATAGTHRIKQTRSCAEERKYTGVQHTVPEFSRRFNIWRIGVDSKGGGHVAVFPEKLAEDHILSWSKPGDLVLDPFNGSGTTGKMAVKNARNYLGLEISPEYAEMSRKRIAASLPEDFLSGL